MTTWLQTFSKPISHLWTARGRSILIASLVATGVLSSTKPLGLFEPLERFSFDVMLRFQDDRPLDPRLLIVGITEADLQQYGWPMSDAQLAELLANIQVHQPSVVGLDLYRSNDRPPGSEALQAQLQAENLIAIKNVGSDSTIGEVPAPPSVPQERVGFNDLPIDPDGILRRGLIFVRSRQTAYYSFALRVVLQHLGSALPLQTTDDALILGDTQFPVITPGAGGYQNIDDRGYQILLHYRNSAAPALMVSASQVLSGQLDPALIRDRVVLIGSVAASLKDQFYNPYSATRDTEFMMSGVVVHAHMISQMLDAVAGTPALYRFMPQWGETLWLLGWAIAAGVVVWAIKRPLGVVGAGAIMLLSITSLGWLGIANLVWLPIAEPMLGVLIAGGIATLQKLLYRSTHDALTGLPLRDVLIVQIQRSLQSSPMRHEVPAISVAFLDVDRFKLINQSLGHSTGDRVLRTIAKRIRQAIPPAVQLARVGGDEFALLFQNTPREQIEQALDELQQILSEPFQLNDHQLSITASVGLAIAQEGHKYLPENLMRDAYTAMYRAKSLGRSRYEIFSTGMQVEAMNRLRLESDLQTALNQDEFVLYYQPIVQLDTGKIAGFEALVRWSKPENCFVPPDQFIPIAEDTGLIVPLGQWIFREACRQLKVWQQQFPDYALKMSINLSQRQFEQADLVQQIDTVLTEVEIPPNTVQLEITESTAMIDVEAAIALMVRIRQLGVRFSIDDFGTGYSSLSYLHRLPVDALKVDKSFVGRMEQSSEDRDIVQTMISLGHKLGMEVIAEGIERSSHLANLREHQCDYGQGYLFSAPLPASQATALLHQISVFQGTLPTTDQDTTLDV
ncbi:putative bifunctional diguanylate cyclase/phosphodiesterase [Leptolyngbya sp. AN02str]|uniref:putative bifunctional diguanylate cyclase/phosphodiesterase n=1 Tax=Leptolyngbya sp. AN02str TaxID=3423363 RepID=UPI003D32227C